MQLSKSEIKVLRTFLLHPDYTTQNAADALCISVNTLRCHLRNIYGKLNVRNRTSALLKATAQGLI